MGIIEKMKLDGKKGFITGAARGIGKCTATAFAEAGADVAIVDMDLETAQAIAQEIAQATGRKVIALQCDVTDEAQVQVMVDEVVKQLGGLNFCHANAGICINAAASMSAHIVNVPQPQCAYNASKAGVIQLTKSLAIEWAKRGVRVNSISPGYIGTDLTLSSETLKPFIAQWNAMAPMGRLGKPEELASICVYLAGDTSSFTTGADFVLDGAFTCF